MADLSQVEQRFQRIRRGIYPQLLGPTVLKM
jgi:hypothetical protein